LWGASTAAYSASLAAGPGPGPLLRMGTPRMGAGAPQPILLSPGPAAGDP